MQNIFTNITEIVTQLIGYFQGIALVVSILCFAVAGLMHMFGEESSRKAKHWMVGVAIGALVVFCADAIGSTIQDVSGF